MGRVAAVIRGDHEDVAFLHLRQEGPEPVIELDQAVAVALNVAAVTPGGVEVDQIDKNQALIEHVHALIHVMHAVEVALIVDGPGDALTGEDILDLADAGNRQTRVLDVVHDGRFRRDEGEVAAVGGTREIAGLADERAGDDAGAGMFADEDLAGGAAVFIQQFRRDDALVRGDLEDAVRGGIDDEVAGLHVLLAEFLDDLGAGGDAVAKNAAARGFTEGLQNFFGEAVRISRHGIRADDAADFPMTDGGIFPGGEFLQTGNGTGGFLRGLITHHAFNIAEADGLHHGQFEAGDALRDVAKGVRIMIAKSGGIRRGAASDAV